MYILLRCTCRQEYQDLKYIQHTKIRLSNTQYFCKVRMRIRVCVCVCSRLCVCRCFSVVCRLYVTLYLPPRIPRPRGLYAIMQMPSSSHTSFTSSPTCHIAFCIFVYRMVGRGHMSQVARECVCVYACGRAGDSAVCIACARVRACAWHVTRLLRVHLSLSFSLSIALHSN